MLSSPQVFHSPHVRIPQLGQRGILTAWTSAGRCRAEPWGHWLPEKRISERRAQGVMRRHAPTCADSSDKNDYNNDNDNYNNNSPTSRTSKNRDPVRRKDGARAAAQLWSDILSTRATARLGASTSSHPISSHLDNNRSRLNEHKNSLSRRYWFDKEQLKTHLTFEITVVIAILLMDVLHISLNSSRLYYTILLMRLLKLNF